MHLFSSVMFALSANIDTLIVGISYGIKKSRIPLLENIIISLITFAGTLCSICMGMQITLFIPASAARIFGSLILIALGLYYVIKFLLEVMRRQYRTEQRNAEEKEVKKITIKEAVIIACALSVNNMGMGIGASIAGMGMISTSVSTLLFCILFLYMGNKIGSISVSHAMHKYSGPVSGLILILLGIYELLL